MRPVLQNSRAKQQERQPGAKQTNKGKGGATPKEREQQQQSHSVSLNVCSRSQTVILSLSCFGREGSERCPETALEAYHQSYPRIESPVSATYVGQMVPGDSGGTVASKGDIRSLPRLLVFTSHGYIIGATPVPYVVHSCIPHHTHTVWDWTGLDWTGLD